MSFRTVSLDPMQPMDLGSSSQSETADASTSTRRESYATNVDADGFVVPSIRWKRAGDPYNRSVMERLKKEQPILYKSMIYRKWDKKNFPGREYGKAYFKRGVPGSWSYETFGKSWSDANADQRAARTKYGFRGYGSYWGRTLGGMAGRALGNRIGLGRAGASIGSRLGDIASDYIDKRIGIRGSGAYEPNIMSSLTNGNMGDLNGNISNNSLINNNSPTRYMGGMLDETNSICITHSEFIMDLRPTSDSFQTLAFLSLNPGLSASFPWLSNIAQFYEEYVFEQLVFSFKSMVTEGNATASGTVIMATQYNPASAKFQSKQTMENYDFAQSCKVTADAVHGVECDVNKRGGPAIEYVRVGDVPTGQDVKTYDMATFQIAVSGGFANLVVGELWVSYKVRLGKSKIFGPGTVGRLNSGWGYFTLSGATAAAPLGATPPTVYSQVTAVTSGGVTTLVQPNTNLVGLQLSSNVITLPENVNTGKFAILLSYSSMGTLPTAAPTFSGSNCSISVSILDDIHTTNATALYYVEINVSSPPGTQCTLTIGGLTSLASGVGSLRINQIFSTS